MPAYLFRYKKYCVLIAIGLIGSTLYAQDKVISTDSVSSEMQIRAGFSINKKLTRNLTISVEEEVRAKNYVYNTVFDATNTAIGGEQGQGVSFDRSYTFVGLDYRFNPYLKAGLGYTFILINHDGKKSTDYDNYWAIRHRLQADVTGSIRLGQWKLSLRERAMVNLRFDSINALEKNKAEWIFRSKLGAEYTVRSLPLKPYAYVELSNTLNAIGVAGVNSSYEPIDISGNYIDKIKPCIGLKYRINSRNSLDFYYRMDIDTDRDINYDYKKDKVTLKQIEVTTQRSYIHVIGVAYCFDWE